jgi:hypothetical protein
LLALIAALGVPAGALAQSAVRLDAGLEYTAGDYGGDVEYEDVYVPLTLTYELRRVDLRLTVPYLEVETAADTTQSGLGDVIAGLTVYDVWRSADGTLALDFTAKVKLGTADETQGLGSGETDYSAQAGLFKAFGRGGLSTGVGYKSRGDTEFVELENAWFAYVGGLRSFSPRTQAGLFFDYREASIAGNDAVQELSAFIARRTASRWGFQVYLIKGLNDTSPDWGGGIATGARF